MLNFPLRDHVVLGINSFYWLHGVIGKITAKTSAWLTTAILKVQWVIVTWIT